MFLTYCSYSSELRAMQLYIGTSGWSYDWNPDGFDWYIKNSNLNSAELNASFYRFPFPNMVLSWNRKSPHSFRWAIKVNRLVTHASRFSERAVEYWSRFKELFEVMDEKIEFFLFQLPPSSTPTQSFIDRLEKFIAQIKLGQRFALEYRNIKWFEDDWRHWAESQNITPVSIDSPDFPNRILNVNGLVYLRMHGRTSWYSHRYTDEELKEIASRIRNTNPKKVYIFFNNNHDMLDNARSMKEILS